MLFGKIGFCGDFEDDLVEVFNRKEFVLVFSWEIQLLPVSCYLQVAWGRSLNFWRYHLQRPGTILKSQIPR